LRRGIPNKIVLFA